jgi:hypothetical protein
MADLLQHVVTNVLNFSHTCPEVPQGLPVRPKTQALEHAEPDVVFHRAIGPTLRSLVHVPLLNLCA